MRAIFICAAAAFATLLCVRCGWADDTTQKSDSAPVGGTRIAVYDIDRVAHDIGWTADVQTNLFALQHQFQSDLKRDRDMYQQQILDQKRQWAPGDSDKLTFEQKDALAKMNAFANRELTVLNESGAQKLASYRQQWIVEYRTALRPILKQVAEYKKLDIIFEKNDGVQFYNSSSDITDLILDAAKAHPPTVQPVTTPSMPRAPEMELKWPSTQPATAPAGPEE